MKKAKIFKIMVALALTSQWMLPFAGAKTPASQSPFGVYFMTGDGNINTNTAEDALNRYGPDGSGATVVKSSLNASPGKLAMDSVRKKAYFLQATPASGGTQSGLYSLDLTTGDVTQLKVFAQGVTYGGIAYDSANDYIYYMTSDGLIGSNTSEDALNRIRPDGTDASVIKSSINISPGALTLDVARHQAYFLQAAGSATTPGLYVTDLDTGATTQLRPFSKPSLNSGIAYDPIEDYIYYVTSDNNINTNTDEDAINRVRPDGTGNEVVKASVNASPGPLALDLAGRKAYFLQTANMTNGTSPGLYVLDLNTLIVSQLKSFANQPSYGGLALMDETLPAFLPSASQPAAESTWDGSPLKLQFSTPLIRGVTGAVTIRDVTAGSTLESIPYTSSRISGWGSQTLTVSPVNAPTAGHTYAVLWDRAAMQTYYGTSIEANNSENLYKVTFSSASASISAPTITDGSVSPLSATTAIASGKVNDNGSDTAVSFEYGPTTQYGSEKTADTGATVMAGTGPKDASATLSGLQPGDIYHVRVKAVNGAGTTYSSDMTVFMPPSSDASINPTTATFDKNPDVQADVTTNVDAKGYDLNEVTLNGNRIMPLAYSFTGSTLTFSKDFLSTLPNGPADLVLKFSGGAAQTLTVTVKDTTPPKSSTKTVSSFTFAGLSPNVSGTIDEANKTIALTVPYGTDVTALVPTIAHDGKTIMPASGAAQDFTNPVLYTVTAENNTTAAYTVTVTAGTAPVPAAPSTPSLTSASDTGWSSIDRVTSSSTPEFSGTAAANVQVYLFADLNNNGILDSGELLGQDSADVSGKWKITSSFLNEGEYPIRATAAQTPGHYSAASGVTTVTIDKSAPTITSVEVPSDGTYSPGDSLAFNVHIDRDVVVEGFGGTPRVALTVGSQTVYANYESGSGTSVLTFSYTVMPGDRDANGITVGPLGINGGRISSRAGNELNPMLNGVGSTAGVLVGADSTKTMGSFTFDALNPSVTGVVNEANRTIEATVPYGTDVTALVPTLTHGGASVLPASGVPQDFSVPVTYTVTAADGSTADYTVHVKIASNTSKEALDFRFDGLSPVVQGTINEADKTITATVPYGTNVTALVPAFSHSGASVQPESGIPQDFNSPVPYTVTAANGSTAVYTVTVKVAPPSSDTQLDGFGLSGGTLEPVFSSGEKNYKASVVNSVSAVTLLPHARHAGAHVTVNGTQVVGNVGIPVGLNVGSNTITVTVLAEDGIAFETYTLVVTRAEAANTPSPSNPSAGGPPDSAGTTAPASPTTQRIEVDVDLGGGSSVVTKTIVERTKTASGTKDAVTLEPDKTKIAVDQAIAAGGSTIRVVIPDVADEVSQTDVTLPIASLRTIATNNRNLEIATRDVRIAIPSGSLTGLGEDVYFRVVPIKESGKQKELLNRVTTESLVRDASGGAGLNPFVVARPMTIETNLQSREVKLTLPLSGVQLPSDSAQRQAFLDSLAIYVEHGDGDRELLRGTVVNYAGTQQGLAFDIDKFSTFTILSWKGGNLAELISRIDAGSSAGSGQPSAGESNEHRAYIRGYADSRFHPEDSLTRAQLAMMVASLLGYDGGSSSSASAFPDVARAHWAAGAIAYVNECGYLIGDNTGSFRPNAAITRAEMAALAIRLKPLQDVLAPPMPFSDVSSFHWAASAIAQARQEGLITGYADGTFRPSAAVTRAEAVTMLNRMFGRLPLSGEVKPSWADVAPSYWAYGNIEEASRNHRFTIGEDAAEHIAP